jgi:hypothetical protein
MLRHRTLFVVFFVVIAAAVLVSAEDDIQVIPAKRSTLSIYSYGGTEGARVVPEYRDGARRTRRTGGLTDVVSNPPLATSPQVSGSAKTPSPSFTPRPAAAVPVRVGSGMTFGSSPRPNSAGSMVSAHAETALSLPPGSLTVTVAWDPSPDEAVVGYQLYSGNRSGHYSNKTPLGNQTSAQVALSDSALYLAVSAYTAEGLESVLSNEVTVSDGNDVVIPSSGGGTSTVNSGSQ